MWFKIIKYDELPDGSVDMQIDTDDEFIEEARDCLGAERCKTMSDDEVVKKFVNIALKSYISAQEKGQIDE